MNGRTFPVMRDDLRGGFDVPWLIGEEAWMRYHQTFTGQSCERIAERGGFGESEMDEYRPGWREFIIERAVGRK